MDTTLTTIRQAIASYHVRMGVLPRVVVVSDKELLPAAIAGVPTAHSKDLNPGDYRINDEPNWQPYWNAALKQHRERIALGCVSAIGVICVGKGKEDLTRVTHRDKVTAALAEVEQAELAERVR